MRNLENYVPAFNNFRYSKCSQSSVTIEPLVNIEFSYNTKHEGEIKLQMPLSNARGSIKVRVACAQAFLTF